MLRGKQFRPRAELMPAALTAPFPPEVGAIVLVERDALLPERGFLRAGYLWVLFHKVVVRLLSKMSAFAYIKNWLRVQESNLRIRLMRPCWNRLQSNPQNLLIPFFTSKPSFDIKKHIKIGRGREIRTPDSLLPKQVAH